MEAWTRSPGPVRERPDPTAGLQSALTSGRRLAERQADPGLAGPGFAYLEILAVAGEHELVEALAGGVDDHEEPVVEGHR